MSKFGILVLEDAVVTSVLLSRAIEFELPDALVLRAQSLFEARLLLKTYEVHFFILDIQLPDGSGIDLLPEIVSKSPNAGVVILTAFTLPKYRARANEFGVLHFMEKPVDNQVLVSVIRSYMSGALGKEPPTVSSDTSFTASLKKLAAIDVVQLKCLARATVVLDFTLRDQRHGRIHLRDGEVVHAEVNEHSRTRAKEGEAAFREILGWRAGKVEEIHSVQSSLRTIEKGWQELILDAVKWIDENAAEVEADLP